MKRFLTSPGVRKWAKIVVALVALATVTAAFFGVRECAFAAKVQFVPAVLALNAAALAVLAAVVAVRARLYCEVLCPLGVAQDLVRWVSRKKVRRVCTRLPSTKRQLAVRWAIAAAAVLAGSLGLSFVWLDPYAIFGRGISLAGGLFFVVLILALVGHGRIWCNWVCPVGTILQAMSRIAMVKNKVAKCDNCKECRKCFRN